LPITEGVATNCHPKLVSQDGSQYRTVFSHKQQRIVGYVFIDFHQSQIGTAVQPITVMNLISTYKY